MRVGVCSDQWLSRVSLEKLAISETGPCCVVIQARQANVAGLYAEKRYDSLEVRNSARSSLARMRR